MRLLDVSFNRPAENLALDELLLDRAESGHGYAGETLRFWESPKPFVVLGVTQSARKETFFPHCSEDNIPVLRRCSAGGCVLQGAGCLNYTLILGHAKRPDLRTIRESYCYILGTICESLQRRGVLAHHKGVSDIAVGGKKVSGSSQRRRRRFLMHHGTLLYQVNFDLIERYLREPEERPQYRGPRTHRGFLTSLPLTAEELRRVVCEAFGVKSNPSQLSPKELEAVKDLSEEKYGDSGWNLRR